MPQAAPSSASATPAAVCGVRAEVLLARDVPDWRAERGRAPRSRVERQGEQGVENSEDERERRRKDREELENLGLLVPNLELNTGCSPAYLPGNPPSTLAQSLSQRMLTLLHFSDLIDLDDLKIWHVPEKTARKETTEMEAEREGQAGTARGVDDGGDDGGEEEDEGKAQVKAFWTLYIDVLFISLDGNAFDAAWGAVLAALKDTKLPRAWWDVERDMVLCDDRIAEAKHLELRGFPVAATFAVFEPTVGGRRDGTSPGDKAGSEEKKAWVLADPDDFEEALCGEGVTVVVDERNGAAKMLRIEKGGGEFVGVKEVRECVRLAGERWREWKRVLEATG